MVLRQGRRREGVSKRVRRRAKAPIGNLPRCARIPGPTIEIVAKPYFLFRLRRFRQRRRLLGRTLPDRLQPLQIEKQIAEAFKRHRIFSFRAREFGPQRNNDFRAIRRVAFRPQRDDTYGRGFLFLLAHSTLSSGFGV